MDGSVESDSDGNDGNKNDYGQVLFVSDLATRLLVMLVNIVIGLEIEMSIILLYWSNKFISDRSVKPPRNKLEKMVVKTKTVCPITIGLAYSRQMHNSF